MIFFFLILLIFVFFIAPFFPDPRTWVRGISVFTFFLGLFFYWKKNPFPLQKIHSITFFIRVFHTAFLRKKIWIGVWIGLLGFHLFFLSQVHLQSLFLTENDFVSMSEILNETLKGNFFHDSFHGNMESGIYLAHHFSPSLLYLAPFLYLSETRMGYSYGLIFYSLLGVYFFYLNIQGFPLKKKIFLLTFFLLNLFNYRLLTSYHFEILVLPFFLGWYYFIQTKKKLPEIIFFVSLLGLKEDISIYIILFSFFFLWKKEYLRFSIYFLIPMIYYFLCLPFFQSFLDQSTKENWLSIWGRYGSTISEILVFFLKNPHTVLAELWTRKKVIIDLYGSFSFIPLFSPYTLPSAIPILFLHLLSERIWHNSFYHYYSYTILPVLWVGVWSFLKRNRHKSKATLYLYLGILLYFSGSDKHYPLSFLSPISPDYKAIQNLIPEIPYGKEIQVSFQLGACLPRHLKIYPLKNLTIQKEYILYAPSELVPILDRKREEETLKKLEYSGKILLVFQENQVKLYKKQE